MYKVLTLPCCLLLLVSCGSSKPRPDAQAPLRAAEQRQLALRSQIDSLKSLSTLTAEDSASLQALAYRLSAEEANLANMRTALGVTPLDESIQRQYEEAQKDAAEARLKGERPSPSLTINP